MSWIYFYKSNTKCNSLLAKQTQSVSFLAVFSAPQGACPCACLISMCVSVLLSVCHVSHTLCGCTLWAALPLPLAGRGCVVCSQVVRSTCHSLPSPAVIRPLSEGRPLGWDFCCPRAAVLFSPLCIRGLSQGVKSKSSWGQEHV